jgi:hypothetical protein
MMLPRSGDCLRILAFLFQRFVFQYFDWFTAPLI